MKAVRSTNKTPDKHNNVIHSPVKSTVKTSEKQYNM